jgi:hypothetical protein
MDRPDVQNVLILAFLCYIRTALMIEKLEEKSV